MQFKNSFYPRSSRKKLSQKTVIKLAAFAVGIFGFAYGVKEWKGHVVERAFYVSKSAFNLNSASNEFRMAVICHKLQKQNCKEMALAKAFKKSPENEKIVGEYAIALTESKKYDQAILTFQKFFSMSEGTPRHMAKYGESLGQKEYYTDAKEQFYKAIKAQPENLELAEAMMTMLTSSHMYGEALSIIGHFNMTIPKTQKIWHNLTLKIKAEFKDYQEKYAIKEMIISKLGNYFFAPAIMNGSLETQLFIVNPDSVYTTVDAQYLKNNGIPHESKGQITVTANNGQQLTGTRVIIPSVMFGAWTLTNVEAIACDNCAFLAGKSVLNKLSIQTSQVNNTQVNLLSMKEK
jgi:tetratricopeptide (TPR) repeat protein